MARFILIIMVPDKRNGKQKKQKEEKKDIRSDISDAYKSFDAGLKDAQRQDRDRRKEVFEEGIERIEKKSEKDLIASKMLVGKVLELRKRAGMAETIGTAGKVKTPMLFGKDEFKQKLVQEIMVIGTEELEDIGSAITVVNLIDYFRETRPNWKVGTGEILEVIRKLEEKEVIPPKVDLGEEEVLIRFKPIEMSNDIQEILMLATGLPSLSVDKVASHLGWSMERAQSTMTLMMKMDLAILEEESGDYYFPGIAKM